MDFSGGKYRAFMTHYALLSCRKEVGAKKVAIAFGKPAPEIDPRQYLEEIVL
jgi:hypothetical protein